MDLEAAGQTEGRKMLKFPFFASRCIFLNKQ